jgi:hypothetical protein
MKRYHIYIDTHSYPIMRWVNTWEEVMEICAPYQSLPVDKVLVYELVKEH